MFKFFFLLIKQHYAGQERNVIVFQVGKVNVLASHVTSVQSRNSDFKGAVLPVRNSNFYSDNNFR